MKKLIFLSLVIFNINLFATNTQSDYANNLTEDQKTKLKAPLLNLLKTTQFDLFLTEFEMTGRVKKCGKGLETAWGFETHMIEPIGYAENSKEPLYFPFAKVQFSQGQKGKLEASVSRNHSVEEGSRDSFLHSHFIYVPIFGMIFKKKLKLFCFNKGDIAFPAISKFDLSYQNDLIGMKMLPHMIAMFNPQTLLSTVIDCAATEGTNAIKGYTTNTYPAISQTEMDAIDESYQAPQARDRNRASQTTLKEHGEEALNFIRNSMYYNVGCLGFSPVGGYVEGSDPGTDTVLVTHGTIAKLHGASALLPKPILYKQTNFGMETSVPYANNVKMIDTMCKPEKFALPIKSQYLMQRAYPTVGKASEFGSSGLSTVASNVPGSKDEYVYLVWERRDYAAFAYFCPESGIGGE